MAISKIIGSGLGTINSQVEFTSADNLAQLTLSSTDADANSGPNLDFYRNSASPADGDSAGLIQFIGKNDAGQDVTLVQIEAEIADASDGSEDVTLKFGLRRAGAFIDALSFDPTEVVFNDSSVDMDFRVESNGDANMLFVDGGTDRVYMGRNATDGVANARLQIEAQDGEAGLSIHRGSASSGGGGIFFSKSRAATAGDDTVVQSGDEIGKLLFTGADGTDRASAAAAISVEVDGTPGSNDMPGRILFSTTADGAAAVTERMRLNSAGNLLFAKTVTTLTTDGAVLSSGQLTLSAASDSTNHATANGASIALTNGNSTDANFSHIGGYNSNGLVVSQINFINQVQSSRRGVISFNTHDGSSMPERGRFNNFGQFLVGCTQAPSASVPGFAVVNNAGFCLVMQATSDANANVVSQFINPNGVVGSITTNGSATTFATSSDYRLKENVNYDWDATTRLKQLKPARFNFIADADTTVDGFLAHEAQAVVPEAVTGTKDAVQVWKEDEELPDGVSAGDNKLDTDGNTMPDMQGIDQSKLVPLLVKTIQELEARITALEA